MKRILERQWSLRMFDRDVGAFKGIQAPTQYRVAIIVLPNCAQLGYTTANYGNRQCEDHTFVLLPDFSNPPPLPISHSLALRPIYNHCEAAILAAHIA